MQAEHSTSIRTADRQTTKEHGQVKLSKQDYAIVCHARAEKIAVQKRNGKMPRRDYVFTDKKLVLFDNNGRDNFSIRRAIEIEDNEDIIDQYIKEIEYGENH